MGNDQGKGKGSNPLSEYCLTSMSSQRFFISYAGSVRCGRTFIVYAVIVCRLADNDKSKSYGIISNEYVRCYSMGMCKDYMFLL